jgi:hypothetical protein
MSILHYQPRKLLTALLGILHPGGIISELGASKQAGRGGIIGGHDELPRECPDLRVADVIAVAS